MLRALVLDDNYPSHTNLYGDVFAHVRLRGYQGHLHTVVCSLQHKQDYVHEGIIVKSFETAANLRRYVLDSNPDIVLVHFALAKIIDSIILNSSKPAIIWVHGYEAIHWTRRLFNFEIQDYTPLNLYRTQKNNREQLTSFKRLIHASNSGAPISFIFVSKWMKHVCENDCGLQIKHSTIIPNPVNDDHFAYVQKDPATRTHVLSIRSFDSRKYANDVTAEAINLLSHRPGFDRLAFRIFGRGRYFADIRNRLSNHKNVLFDQRFLNHEEIKQQHAWAGIFLCPTRQDAQGVSMCEAMSSGLVPVTSHNTAIPEFVQDGINGLLTKNAAQIADSINALNEDSQLFLSLSSRAARDIRAKAGLSGVIRRELTLINEVVNK